MSASPNRTDSAPPAAFIGVRWYTALAILTLNAIVLFVGAELSARVFVKVQARVAPVPEGLPDRRAGSPYYDDKAWAPQYWKEFAVVGKQLYHPFTTWRRAPFTGKHINIDDRGVRNTPGSDCRPGAFKLFTFGNSHMWGTGAPDWGTIPAYLLGELAEEVRGPICVTNFAESGYVTTQSVVMLLLQLQAGNVPNLALFLDGANDIYTAYQSGRSGLHANFEAIAALVERRSGPQRPFARQLLERSSFFQLVNSQVGRLSASSRPSPRIVTYATMGVDKGALAADVARSYLTNYEAVLALAREYGFEAYFFWPPHVSSGHKALTSEEVKARDALDPALRQLHEAVYEAVHSRRGPPYENLFHVDDVFDDRPEHLWLDASHTTPEGNAMIAVRMMWLIRERQRARARNHTE